MRRIVLTLFVLSSSACATGKDNAMLAAFFAQQMGRSMTQNSMGSTSMVQANSWNVGMPCSAYNACPNGLRCISVNYMPGKCGI